MSEQAPASRTARRICDALIRNQLRGQNDPRRTGRRVGLALALILFPGFAAGLLLVGGGDHPLYLLLFPALLVAILLGALAGVLTTALGYRTVGPHPLPVDADPDDVRAARKVVRSGEASGDPGADRLARTLAAQALQSRFQSPGVIALYLGFLGWLAVFQAAVRYLGEGGWDWIALTHAGLALLVGVHIPVLVPLMARKRRRALDFAEAYDARERAAGEPDAPVRGD